MREPQVVEQQQLIHAFFIHFLSILLTIKLLIMKRLLLFTASLLMVSASIFAQSDYKEFIKERKALDKYNKEQRDQKASKDARKQAKILKKEGWKVPAGSLPLEKQLDRLYAMQYEVDENFFPKFIKGEAQSVGGNYDAAKMQAVNLAKIELAGNISTEVAALVESKVANKQLEANEAVSTTESVMGAKNIIAQSIGQTIVGLEVYRELNNKNKEVRIVILYNATMAKAAAKKAIKEDLEQKGDKLVEQLDQMLGF